MSNEIIKVLEYISDKLGIVVDWTSETALPYVTEVIGRYVNYKIITNSVGLGVVSLLFIVAIILTVILVKSYKKCKTNRSNTTFYHCIKYDYGEDHIRSSDVTDFIIFLIIFFTLIFVIAAPIILCNIIKWSIIPEVQLLKLIA